MKRLHRLDFNHAKVRVFTLLSLSFSIPLVQGGCFPPPPVEPNSDNPNFGEIIKSQFNFEPLKVPRGLNVFDVGSILPGDTTETIRDTFSEVCNNVDLQPREDQGPRKISGVTFKSFTMEGSVGANLSQIQPYLPNLQLEAEMTKVARVDLSFTDIRLRTVNENKLRNEVPYCCGVNAIVSDKKIHFVRTVLIGKAALKFWDRDGKEVNLKVGWKPFGAQVDFKDVAQTNGSYIIDTPIVLGYQPGTLDVTRELDEQHKNILVIDEEKLYEGRLNVNRLIFKEGGKIKVAPGNRLDLYACSIEEDGAKATFLGTGTQPPTSTQAGMSCPNCNGGRDMTWNAPTDEKFTRARDRCVEQKLHCEGEGDTGGTGGVGGTGGDGALIHIHVASAPAEIVCDVRPGCGGCGGPGGSGKKLYYPGPGGLSHECNGCRGDQGGQGNPGTCTKNGQPIGTSSGCAGTPCPPIR